MLLLLLLLLVVFVVKRIMVCDIVEWRIAYVGPRVLSSKQLNGFQLHFII
jgi:hypothetical protein